MGLRLGLDVGSSVAKAALFDDALQEVARAAAPVALDRDRAGRVEFDPGALRATVARLIPEVCARAGIPPAAVASVGIAAAMVGGVLLDAAARPLRPGINWEDARAQGVIDALEARVPGARGRMFRSSGCVVQQGCTLPLLAVLAAEEPALVARAHVFVSLKDWLRAWLTGRIGTDRTEAAVAPGSAVARDRSAAMIALFGLERLAHLLPPAEDSEALGGHVTAPAAAETGLAPGTPVAVGAGDVPCSVLGAGGYATDRATIILGTTAMVGRCVAAPVFDPPDLGLLFTLPGRRWYRAMVNVAGTLNLDWALAALAPDLRAGSDPYAAAEALAASAPPGANGVSYLPYLSECGIIAPVADPAARAGFAGLSPRHRRADLLRAVYEGVAFSLADLLALTGFEGRRIGLVGGGAQSGLWPQLIADVTGCTVDLPRGTEFGARGAAMLAMIADGSLPDVASGAALPLPLRRSLSPDMARAASLRAAFAAYLAHARQTLGHGGAGPRP